MRKGLLASFLCLGMIAAAPVKKEKVLILPFAPTDPHSQLTWIGKAIKSNLVTDFSKSQQFLAISPKDAVPAEDENDALTAARNAGAKYVVFGSFQNQDANLRITGQILDVDTEQAVAGLRATGLIKDLFLLEDALADQARTVLPHPKTPNPVTANAVAESQPQQQQPAVIVQPAELGHGLMAGTYSAEDQYNRYQYQPIWPDYSYPYSYPYYYPPFPFVSSVTVIKSFPNRRFDHFDNSFDHRQVGIPAPVHSPPVVTPAPIVPGPGTPMPIAPSPIAPHNPS